MEAEAGAGEGIRLPAHRERRKLHRRRSARATRTAPARPPHWLIYFAVADVDATFRRAKDMNARTLLPPMDFEGVGRVAILADPQGAVFALYREAGKP